MRHVHHISKFFAVSAFAAAMIVSTASFAAESAGQYVDDATITAKVKSAFVTDPDVKALQISVQTNQGAVQLSGTVDSAKSEQKAVSLAQKVNGVRSVSDNLTVRNPTTEE